MTTKYKWLPEQPTIEMLEALFTVEEPNPARDYRAMWKAAPEVEQDPVESQFYDENNDKWYPFFNEEHKRATIEAGYTVRDLYTHPQPCEPLSEDVIGELIDKLPYGSDYSMEFARMVEKAHGIGETKCI
jgi:hypothetical protein